jgi:hypothetical protein
VAAVPSGLSLTPLRKIKKIGRIKGDTEQRGKKEKK